MSIDSLTRQFKLLYFLRIGGIFCECRPGFTSFAGVGTWEDPCWDINECSQTEKTVCDERTEICANTIGSFICVPLPGFLILYQIWLPPTC